MRKHFTKAWNGSAWVTRPFKVRSGSSFVDVPVKSQDPDNPYEGVDWSTAEYIIGNTHMHSKQQLTTSTESEMFDLSYNAGIRSMAWSNYYDEKVSTPMATYFSPKSIPADAVGLENSEQHRLSDTNLHYCPIGSTQARYGTYSTPVSVDNTWRSMFTEALALLQWPEAGGITLNHPEWTNVSGGGMTQAELLQMLDYDRRVLGIEAYNHKVESLDGTGWALTWWDNILATGRKCFGFFVTDGYDERIYPNPALGHSVLLIDENTAYKAAKAYRDGHFYGTLKATPPHRFTSITSSVTQVSVTVDVAAEIRFYTETGLAQTSSSTTTATYTVAPGQVYVRIEAGTGDDRIFSQPIMYTSL